MQQMDEKFMCITLIKFTTNKYFSVTFLLAFKQKILDVFNINLYQNKPYQKKFIL